MIDQYKITKIDRSVDYCDYLELAEVKVEPSEETQMIYGEDALTGLNKPDTRDADVMAVANAFRQVLKDNFAGDFPSTMAAMQTATAMALIDLTDGQHMTMVQRQAVYNNFGESLRMAYDLMRWKPTIQGEK